MPPVHGSKAFFSIQDSGGVVRDLSALLDTSGLPRSADTAEVTTGGMTAKKYIAGLVDGTIPIGGPFDPVMDGYLNGLLGFGERTYVYRPQGTGTGLVEYGGSAILTSYEPDTAVDDAGRMTGEFQLSGPATRTIQP